MKKFVFSLLLMAAAHHAFAATLDQGAMVGTRQTPEQPGFAGAVSRLFNDPPRDRLAIHDDRSVTLTRYFDDGQKQVLNAPASGVRLQDDLLIVRFARGTGSAQRVLAGWRRPSASRLFGTLYLYDGTGLFNGIPVTYERAGRR